MSERTCRDVRADLSAYLDGDLDAGLTNETRVHLENCAACRSELELLRLTVGALHRLPELPPPAAILSGVRARLRPEPWHRRLFGGGLRHFEFPLGAAATLLVVLGVSLFVARYPDMPKEASQDSSPQSPPAATPAPSRRDLRGKGALDSATPPQDAYRDGEAAAPESSTAAGAAARDLERAAPAVQAVPAEPVATTGLTAAESKADQSRPEPSAPALKDALREEPTRVSGPQARIVCLLLPNGDGVNDLELLLRHEGALGIEVSALEPPALREAAARRRGRLGSQPAPSRGWTVTARIQAPALADLLETLAGRPGLRVLERPAAPAAPGDPAEPLSLSITVFQ